MGKVVWGLVGSASPLLQLSLNGIVCGPARTLVLSASAHLTNRSSLGQSLHVGPLGEVSLFCFLNSAFHVILPLLSPTTIVQPNLASSLLCPGCSVDVCCHISVISGEFVFSVFISSIQMNVHSLAHCSCFQHTPASISLYYTCLFYLSIHECHKP